MSHSPIQNLMLNWWKTELSWISTMNFTKYQCSMAVGNEVVNIQVNFLYKVSTEISHDTLFFFLHILK